MNIFGVVLHIVRNEEYVDIVLIDNMAKDIIGESRMVTESELEEFRRIVKIRGEKHENMVSCLVAA